MRVYPDPGLRPMDDCDLLVPPEAAPAALALMERRGWRSFGNWANTGRSIAEMTELRRRLTHAQHFVASDAGSLGRATEVDLHWFALDDAGNNAEVNADLWSRATTVSLPDGTPVLIPGTTDLLGLTCLHGLRTNAVPPVRWAADATLLMRKSTVGAEGTLPIDWQRLERFAIQGAHTLRLTAALNFLAGTVGQPVPPDTLARLRAAPVSPEERIEFRYWVNGEHHLKAGVGGRLAWEINRVRLYGMRSPGDAAGRSRLGKLRNAVVFLCGRWFYRYPRGLPLTTLRYRALRLWRLLTDWKGRAGGQQSG